MLAAVCRSLVVFLFLSCILCPSKADDDPNVEASDDSIAKTACSDCLTRAPMRGYDCVMVSHPGDYQIAKGTLIELNVKVGGWGCAVYGPSYSITENDAVIRSSLGTKYVNCRAEDVNEWAFYFRAKRLGTDTITISYRDLTFTYHIEVVPCS
jgi:hypothetical protein